jgi:NarL family two-component system response regulator LiaR
METKPRIVIIEDHPVMRKGLTAWFASSERWSVTGTAASLEEAKELFRKEFLGVSSMANQVPLADIVLLDIQLQDGWGLDIIPWLEEQRALLPPETPVSPLPAELVPHFAVYSSFDNYAHINAALGYGVKAYISKQRGEAEVEQILHDVLNSPNQDPPYIDDIVSAKFQNAEKNVNLFTKRESEIFLLIKRGYSNKQIAQALNMSNKTVENHLAHIRDKTGFTRFDLQNL